MNLCKTIRPVTVASGGLQAIFLHFGAKVRLIYYTPTTGQYQTKLMDFRHFGMVPGPGSSLEQIFFSPNFLIDNPVS